MKNNSLMMVIVGIVLVGAGFFGGMKYQQSKAPTPGSGRQFAGAGRTGTGAGNRGGQILGDIISADSSSITVKLTDGSSKIIILGSGTSIVKSTTASATDLTVGTRVAAFGQTNADGSVTAQNIQLNPLMRQATPSATPTK